MLVFALYKYFIALINATLRGKEEEEEEEEELEEEEEKCEKRRRNL